MSADITKPETWYELKLGEFIRIDDKRILARVPGGWLAPVGENISFVPYSDEFLVCEWEGAGYAASCSGTFSTAYYFKTSCGALQNTHHKSFVPTRCPFCGKKTKRLGGK